jgi:TolA-binding protein
MKDRLVRAIGFDSAASRNPPVHFPTNQPATSVGPALDVGLDRVVKSQEQLCDKFEELSERLEGMSRSIESLPEIIDRQSQQLVEAIESLRDLVAQTPNNTSSKEAVVTPANPAKIAEPPKTNPLASEHKTKPEIKPQTPFNGPRSNGASPTKNAGPKHRSSQKSSEKSVGPKARPDSPSTPSPPSIRSWVQRAANQLSGWIPYASQRRRVTAERNEQSESIDLASQSTSKRTRLRQIDNDSELLASNESQGETHVLGSLVGLRYRDARKTYLRWLLFSGIIAALSLIGGPFVWQQIPDGWRELIWQKVTFSEALQDQPYDIPLGDDTRSSRTGALEPEPMPLSLPQTELEMIPSPGQDPLPSEPLPSEPLPSEPLPSEPLPSEPLPNK